MRDVDRRFANLLRARHPQWDVHVLAENRRDTGAHLTSFDRYRRAGFAVDRVVYAYCLNDISDIIPELTEIFGRIYDEKPGFIIDNSFALNTWYWRLRAATDPTLAGYFQRLVDAYEGSIWIAHQQ